MTGPAGTGHLGTGWKKGTIMYHPFMARELAAARIRDLTVRASRCRLAAPGRRSKPEPTDPELSPVAGQRGEVPARDRFPNLVAVAGEFTETTIVFQVIISARIG